MSVETFLDGRVTLYGGDCLAILKTLTDASVDSVVTDPPYHLTSIVKRFGGQNAAPAKTRQTGAFARSSKGFMGKTWDGGDIAFRVELWAEVLRVLKPGGHLVAFSGTRTYHRMAVAIEDAGFEIRDQLAWTYGSGFPKGGLDEQGRGKALKPAWEPIALARKPFKGTAAANIAKHGTGALNIDACRVPFAGAGDERESKSKNQHGDFASGPMTNAVYGAFAKDRENYDPVGRFPANLIHDGSPEMLAAFPAETRAGERPAHRSGIGFHGGADGTKGERVLLDKGSAARFFYTAKADADDRIGSKHPTVKPVDLMQWLVRLITPKGGTVLDLFAGTGTTGEAAFREGCRAILIEREDEYRADIARRMALAISGPASRKAARIAARAATENLSGTLFGLPREAAE